MQSTIVIMVVVINYRTKMLMKKYAVMQKIEKVVIISGSRGCRKQTCMT